MESISCSVLVPAPVSGGTNAFPFQNRSCRPWSAPLPTRMRGNRQAKVARHLLQVRAKATSSVDEEKRISRNDLGFPEGMKSLNDAIRVAGVSIAAAFVVASFPVGPASARAFTTEGFKILPVLILPLRSGDIDLPPIEPEVATVSSSKDINLAKQLKAIGAKMYGAFWCSHCFEQKQMFGKEALKYIEYVECYPEGYRRGVKLAAACSAANIQGFPTWEINGQQYSGEQPFEKLAELSSVVQVMK